MGGVGDRTSRPTGTHAAHPVEGGKNADETSWRCKECHGPDYKGNQGQYASGNHATGIKGIRGMAGADPERIMAVLLRSHPRSAGIPTGILNLARAYLHLGKSDRGRECLQVICRKYPESSECHIARKLLQGQTQG